MSLENQSSMELYETHLIDDIDASGYIVNSTGLENEGDTQNNVNNVGLVNNVDLGNDAHLNLDCNDDDNTINDENIIGKGFSTPHDAYTFYNRYAFVHGFGIRIHWNYKNKTTNEVYRKSYVGNKEGFKRVTGNSAKRRRILKTGCQAGLRVSKTKDGKWCVDVFKDNHNHDLSTTPTKVMKHRSHGKFHRSMACKNLMFKLGQAGLRPSQIKKTVNAMKSPLEPDVISKQCVDILSEQRKQYRGKEFYGLIKHLQDKSRLDINHYYEIELSDDRSPRNIFWADGRSRDAYIKFGDIVFDDGSPSFLKLT